MSIPKLERRSQTEKVHEAQIKTQIKEDQLQTDESQPTTVENSLTRQSRPQLTAVWIIENNSLTCKWVVNKEEIL